MKSNMVTPPYVKRLAKGEATHTAVYMRFAKLEKNERRRNLFLKLAEYGHKHHEFWLSMSGEKQTDFSRMKVFFYLTIRRLFGAMFAVKLMERLEHQTLLNNKENLKRDVSPGKENKMQEVISDEFDHEAAAVEHIRDERTEYVGPVVLGLNDALVELIGVIAGLVAAMSNNLSIGLTGFVVGIASALSMTASYYLSSEFSEKHALESLKGGLYTGGSYFLTVLLLIAPFFIFSTRFTALGLSLTLAFLVICGVSFYSSVVSDRSFRKYLAKMLILGLGVAAATYLISKAFATYLGIDI